MGLSEKNKEIAEKLYQAYVYGYPLVVLDIQVGALTNTEEPTSEKAPINQLIHAKGLARAEDKYIVMLNMDTVYSQAYFDLSREPLYFRKPKTDRYATAELIDAYGDCIEILGTGGIGGNEEVNAVLTGPDYQGTVPEGLVRINMPTNLCWTLIRVLQKDPQDIGNVAAIQKGFDVRPLSAYGKAYTYPRGQYIKENDYVPFQKLAELDAETAFQIINRLLEHNPGKHPDEELLKGVEAYGVGKGKTFRLSGFEQEVQEEIKKFPERIVREFRENSKNSAYGTIKDGWVHPKDTIADFGADYSYRANVAWGGLGANPVKMAIYPTAVLDSEKNPLHSDYDYACHFDSLPPVDGFWSLTLYGDDKYQIPNEINRYGINDRSDIDFNEDGSFDIYIQRKQPSEDKRKNWLPSGTQGFCAVLRLYLPKEEVLNGTWKLPTLTRAEI